MGTMSLVSCGSEDDVISEATQSETEVTDVTVDKAAGWKFLQEQVAAKVDSEVSLLERVEQAAASKAPATRAAKKTVKVNLENYPLGMYGDAYADVTFNFFTDQPVLRSYGGKMKTMTLRFHLNTTTAGRSPSYYDYNWITYVQVLVNGKNCGNINYPDLESDFYYYQGISINEDYLRPYTSYCNDFYKLMYNAFKRAYIPVLNGKYIEYPYETVSWSSEWSNAVYKAARAKVKDITINTVNIGRKYDGITIYNSINYYDHNYTGLCWEIEGELADCVDWWINMCMDYYGNQQQPYVDYISI